LPVERGEPFPVEPHREVQCMRCGTPTPGTATCELCFEAIGELRALAADFGVSTLGPVRHLGLTRPLARQGSRRQRS
jgi:hypothetical protein